jgi:hypothetical protein
MGVPKQLTGEHKCNYFTIYQGLLNHYCNEGNEFLRLTVTGDKAGTITLQKANTRVCNGNFQLYQSKRGSKHNQQ